MNSNSAGWIIHNIDARESSSRMIIFTKELGLIHASYKGNRNNKKKLIVQPFMSLSIEYVYRYKQYFIQNCELFGRQFVFSGEILFSALYLNELLSKLLSFDDKNISIYSLYEYSLANLALLQENYDKYSLWKILRLFEYQLLADCGYLSSFTSDITGREIAEQFYYVFSPENGFTLANDGIPGSILLDFSKGKLESLLAQQVIKNIMRKSIDHALGGKILKTRKLWLSS